MFIGTGGFEPPTFPPQTGRSAKLNYVPEVEATGLEPVMAQRRQIYSLPASPNLHKLPKSFCIFCSVIAPND